MVGREPASPRPEPKPHWYVAAKWVVVVLIGGSFIAALQDRIKPHADTTIDRIVGPIWAWAWYKVDAIFIPLSCLALVGLLRLRAWACSHTEPSLVQVRHKPSVEERVLAALSEFRSGTYLDILWHWNWQYLQNNRNGFTGITDIGGQVDKITPYCPNCKLMIHPIEAGSGLNATTTLICPDCNFDSTKPLQFNFLLVEILAYIDRDARKIEAAVREGESQGARGPAP